MKIGIFGGSFNPVHYGHYQIVVKVLKHHLVDHVIVLPTFQSPFKTYQSEIPVELRWKMLQTTFLSLANVEISKHEIRQKRTTYSYHSLLHFQKRYLEHSLFFILGADAFQTIQAWKEYRKVLQLTELIVFHRVGCHPVELQLPSYARVQHVHLNIPEVSSTSIRNSTFAKTLQSNWLHRRAIPLWKEYRLAQKVLHDKR